MKMRIILSLKDDDADDIEDDDDLLHITISKEDEGRLAAKLEGNLFEVWVRARPWRIYNDDDDDDDAYDGENDDTTSW